ncbi:MAG: hypothetical protein L0H41_05040 [Microlunatus sp.]|nr:hypothetical protein [Microlunatus sp.]MDN5769676.1 hypothetical protein [Microlunatus sp.]MDN5803310.1 hypothetical protein [Microlunatus sp.]
MLSTEDVVRFQTQTLDQIRASQIAAVDAMRTWTKTATIVSDADTYPGKFMAERLPKIEGFPELEMPQMDLGIPEDPREFVDSMFSFAREVLELNRQFARRLAVLTWQPGGSVPEKDTGAEHIDSKDTDANDTGAKDTDADDTDAGRAHAPGAPTAATTASSTAKPRMRRTAKTSATAQAKKAPAKAAAPKPVGSDASASVRPPSSPSKLTSTPRPSKAAAAAASSSSESSSPSELTSTPRPSKATAPEVKQAKSAGPNSGSKEDGTETANKAADQAAKGTTGSAS